MRLCGKSWGWEEATYAWTWRKGSSSVVEDIILGVGLIGIHIR